MKSNKRKEIIGEVEPVNPPALVREFGLAVVTNFGDVALDAGDLLFDSLITNDALKAVPFVGAVYALGKCTYTIANVCLLRQTYNFIKQFNSNVLPEKKRKEYLKKITRKDKTLYKEIERVLLLLNKTIDSIKAKVLANFYFSFCNGTITWSQFCELSDANNRMFVSDYRELLKKDYEKVIDSKTKFDSGEPYSLNLDRLVGLGIFSKNQLSGSLYTPEIRMTDYRYFITDFGLLFKKTMMINVSDLEE